MIHESDAHLPPMPPKEEETATELLATPPALPIAPPLTAESSPPLIEETITFLWTEKIASGAPPAATLKGKCAASPSVFTPPQRRVVGCDAKTVDCDYRLLQQIGEGGMGTVYLAHQVSVDRMVALKFLRGDVAQYAEYLANFMTEGVVMGNLDHPNIMPIYDLGVDEQHGFFIAMKYVQGMPWSHAIGNLSRADNLNILRRVADAIAFAHSKGVLHLDLKPANIMLGEFGEVWVTDWGVATSLNRQGKARSLEDMSLLGGTPAYMPPEMALSEINVIDVRADVYLLGAILFEILTGLPPHPGVNLQETLCNAAQNIFSAALPADDLGAIARKALSARPGERYATVREFQAALRAYEEHFESNRLLAIAQKDLERAGENGAYSDYAQALYGFHNALQLWPGNSAAAEGLTQARLAYAACAFRRGDFELALSQLDTGDERHRALWQEVKEAQKARAVMVEAKARAEARAREEGERAARINEFLLDMLAAANPAKAGRHVTVLEVMAQSSRTVDERFGGDPKICATIHLTIGQTYNSLGATDQAISHLTRAMAICEQLYGRRSAEYLEAYFQLALVYLSQRQGEKMEAAIRDIFSLYESLPASDEEKRAHYTASLGSALMLQHRYPEAEACYRQAKEVFERLKGLDDYSALAATSNLAAAISEQGRHRESEDIFRQIHSTCLSRYGAKHPDTIRSANNLAYLLFLQNRHEEAVVIFQEVTAAKEEILGPEHPDTLRSMESLAQCLVKIGKESEALVLRRRVVEISRRCHGGEHRNTAIYLNNLAVMLLEAKDIACRNAVEALALAEEAVRFSNEKDYRYLATLASALFANQRLAEAVAMQERVLHLMADQPREAQREQEENLCKYCAALQSAGGGA